MATSLRNRIAADLKDSSRVLARTAALSPLLERAAEALIAAYRRGNKVMTFAV